MKKSLLKIAFATFAILLCCNCRAQELLEEFASSVEYTYYGKMFYRNDDELLVKAADDSFYHLLRYNNDGEMIDSELICERGDNSWELVQHPNGSPRLFVINNCNDTATMKCAIIGDDTPLTYFDFEWIETCNNFDRMECRWILNKDGTVFFAQNVDSLFYKVHSSSPYNYDIPYGGMRVIKFGADGSFIKEIILKDIVYAGYYPGDYLFTLLPTPDTLGFRLKLMASNGNGVRFKCLTFNSEMDTVSINEHIDNMSYPTLPSDDAYFCMNYHNGKTYSICAFSFPAYNNIPEHRQDILMSMWDENFEQKAWTYGMVTSLDSYAGDNSIVFDDNDGVYTIGGMDIYTYLPTSLYLGYLDENLNKHNEIYYKDNYFSLLFRDGMCYCHDGSVLFSCSTYDPETHLEKHHLYKVRHEAFLGIGEAHAAGFAVATAYPNPGNNVMNIRTTLQKSHINVYDLNGKLIHNQKINDVVTSINTDNWPSGVYIWKVTSEDGSEMESGKWVKE